MRVGSHYSVISGVHLSYSTNSTAGSSWAQLNWTTAVGRVFTADFSQLPRPAARSHSGRPSPVDIVARPTGCYSVLRDELAWSPQTSDSCALLRLLLRHVNHEAASRAVLDTGYCYRCRTFHGLCVCWAHQWVLPKRWTDRDAVCGQTPVGPRNRVNVLDADAHWRHHPE